MNMATMPNQYRSKPSLSTTVYMIGIVNSRMDVESMIQPRIKNTIIKPIMITMGATGRTDAV